MATSVAATHRWQASTRRPWPSSRPASASGTPTSRSSQSCARARSGSAGRRRCGSSRPTRRRDVHPQTVIEHFGSWNAAKRQAGLVPRRFATREELLGRLRALGEELGRTPTARDIDERKGSMPSKSLLWHTFGSLAQALREAGFDVPSARSGSSAPSSRAPTLARSLGRLPKMDDWKRARHARPSLLTEWQVYRMIDVQPAWAAFQFLVRERLHEEGAGVAPDGTLAYGLRRYAARARSPRAAARQETPSCGARIEGRIVSSTYERSGWKRWRALDPAVDRRGAACPRRPRACAASAGASARAPRARLASRRRRAPCRPVPIQSGRPTARARIERRGSALVEPARRHRAVQLLERLRPPLGVLREREDRLGVDRHLGRARAKP